MTYEIWLNDEYSHFERGVAHLDDGRTVELRTCPHIATYGPDSLLIDHGEEGRWPLRWFIRETGLEFYSVCEDTPDVYFHNGSGKPLRIGDICELPDGKSFVAQIRKENETTVM